MMRNLNDIELSLLKTSVAELVDEISNDDNADCHYVRQKAIDHWSEKGEHLQVHIMVIRNEDDFLPDFQTEIMNPYKPKKS